MLTNSADQNSEDEKRVSVIYEDMILRGMYLKLTAFLTSALAGGAWLVSHSSHFTATEILAFHEEHPGREEEPWELNSHPAVRLPLTSPNQISRRSIYERITVIQFLSNGINPFMVSYCHYNYIRTQKWLC
jgi:hypothetical protein